ncbi:LpqB family beta-propeller domain-containing protein [Pseudonocardia sp. HH130630-07]|uniref:LpqB family beta-propeller domain-containing protein n=1 Tax=Pseudonocardia sp. HH130630-07 TaxID=1690815 RepID=UPI0012E9FAD5|nr:LpqB family beta-propeller domain-containing protein [Pseudonocardia sp. HH130630-07]
MLVCLAVLAGCASVPEHSSVQVIRQTGDTGAAVPDGPIEDADPLGLVRGFVNNSGSPEERHASARRYLADSASTWDDGATLTVLSERFDTVFAPSSADAGPDRAVVRLRADRLGQVSPSGAFEPGPQPVEIDIGVVRQDDRWRIERLPPGVLVRLSDFRGNYRSLRAWFVDPRRNTLLSDPHYIPNGRPGELAARAMDVLMRGPSRGLAGAAVTAFPATAKLRSAVAETPDGVVLVDLTGVSGLEPPDRQRLAAQIVLTLAEVSVPRVRLLSDGEPLLPDRPELTRDDVGAMVATPERIPAYPLVVDDGRVHRVVEGGQDEPVAGQAGNGSFDVVDAASSPRAGRIAVVSREESGTQRLLVGPADGQLSATPVSGSAVTALSWNASGDEIWAVADGRVRRVLVPAAGAPGEAAVDTTVLDGAGPVVDLAHSREGGRIAVVADGRLLVAPVVPGPAGAVALGPTRALRPNDLDGVVAVDWRSEEQLVVASDSERPVVLVTIDGLVVDPLSGTNLTAPLHAVTAAPGRPIYVTDRTGMWTFSGSDLDAWKQASGTSTSARPFYPG